MPEKPFKQNAVIAGKNYPKLSLKAEPQFSYEPYAYKWQDAYMVEV